MADTVFSKPVDEEVGALAEQIGENAIRSWSGSISFTNGQRTLAVTTTVGRKVKAVLNVISTQYEGFYYTISNSNSSNYTIIIHDAVSPTVSADLPVTIFYVADE